MISEYMEAVDFFLIKTAPGNTIVSSRLPHVHIARFPEECSTNVFKLTPRPHPTLEWFVRVGAGPPRYS